MAEPVPIPHYWPIWNAYNFRNPWQILDTTTGDVVRKPPEGNQHQALIFPTPEAALAKIAKLNRKRGAH